MNMKFLVTFETQTEATTTATVVLTTLCLVVLSTAYLLLRNKAWWWTRRQTTSTADTTYTTNNTTQQTMRRQLAAAAGGGGGVSDRRRGRRPNHHPIFSWPLQQQQAHAQQEQQEQSRRRRSSSLGALPQQRGRGRGLAGGESTSASTNTDHSQNRHNHHNKPRSRSLDEAHRQWRKLELEVPRQRALDRAMAYHREHQQQQHNHYGEQQQQQQQPQQQPPQPPYPGRFVFGADRTTDNNNANASRFLRRGRGARMAARMMMQQQEHAQDAVMVMEEAMIQAAAVEQHQRQQQHREQQRLDDIILLDRRRRQQLEGRAAPRGAGEGNRHGHGLIGSGVNHNGLNNHDHNNNNVQQQQQQEAESLGWFPPPMIVDMGDTNNEDIHQEEEDDDDEIDQFMAQVEQEDAELDEPQAQPQPQPPHPPHPFFMPGRRQQQHPNQPPNQQQQPPQQPPGLLQLLVNQEREMQQRQRAHDEQRRMAQNLQEFRHFSMMIAREVPALFLALSHTGGGSIHNNNTTTATTTFHSNISINGYSPWAWKRFLQQLRDNDPTITTFTKEVYNEQEALDVVQALKHNKMLHSMELHPAQWTSDLSIIKQLAQYLATATSLQKVKFIVDNRNHNNRNRGSSRSHYRARPDDSTANGPYDFVTQLGLNILVQAVSCNSATHYWVLQGPGSIATTKVCRALKMAPYLKQLDVSGFCTPDLATAIAASTSLTKLHLYRDLAEEQLNHLFTALAQSQNNTLQELIIVSCSQAGTRGLQTYLQSQYCQLEYFTLGSIYAFSRPDMDLLIAGLCHNTTVKHIVFTDCSFHPECVRPLQDLVRTRTDLRSFKISRCNADPSMAIVTCFQNSQSQLQTLDVSSNIGIEDRLGGNAIRSMLRSNPNLTELILVGSRLNAIGYKHLSKGLAKNNTLRKLDISHGGVRREALGHIVQAIVQNERSGLQTLNLSYNAITIQGVDLLISEWLSKPHCQLKELKLNRCEVNEDAFLRMIQLVTEPEEEGDDDNRPTNTSLEVLEMMEASRLTVNGLQTVAVAIGRMRHLKVLKASCYKAFNAMAMAAEQNATAGGGALDGDDDDDDEDMREGTNNDNNINDGNATNPIGMASRLWRNSLKILIQAFYTSLSNNHVLEEIRLDNMLEAFLKPRPTQRIHSWMDFCGRRNQLKAVIGTCSIQDLLLDIAKTSRDYRRKELTTTGLSLVHHCLLMRPDALSHLEWILRENEDDAVMQEVTEEMEDVCGEENAGTFRIVQ